MPNVNESGSSIVPVKLAQLGLNENQINGVLEILEARATIEFTNVEDAELADAMRELAWIAIEEATIKIKFGAPGEQMGLIKTILARTASMVGSETTTRYELMRSEFDEMVSEIRGGDVVLEEPFDMEELDSD
jgi:hypothetical protein